MIRVVFFDLFFTLIYPTYEEANNEFDVLHISAQEWEEYAEEEKLYNERALGKVCSEEEIISKIVQTMPYVVSEEQKQQLLERRLLRMRRAYQNVSEDILGTLIAIKQRNIKLCLISNADVIDCRYWKDSKLSACFDAALFSYDVHLLKPDVRIYQVAMERLGVKPEESLFVGDGGSKELAGARLAGMRTVFSECLEQKPEEKKRELLKYADYHVLAFQEILRCL